MPNCRLHDGIRLLASRLFRLTLVSTTIYAQAEDLHLTLQHPVILFDCVNRYYCNDGNIIFRRPSGATGPHVLPEEGI